MKGPKKLKNLPPGLRRYWAGKRRKRKSHKRHTGGHVAKKRKRRHYSKRSHRRGRRRGGGGIFSSSGLSGDVGVIAAGAVYGIAEKKSKEDATFLLNKLPKPIDALGFAGNTALMLYVAGYFTRNRYVKLAARGTATVAAYQMTRKGEAFKAGDEHFAVSGDDDDLLGDDDMSLLGDEVEGISYDDAVEEAAVVER